MQSSADKPIQLLFFLFAFILVSNTVYADETYSFEVPFDIIDIAVAADGSIHLLTAGSPHIRVYEDSVLTDEYDLPEIILPGGFFIDNDWGWFVSDAVGGVIQRYDNSGELLETFPVSGRPGAVAALGLSVLYVSRADGSIGSIDGSGFPEIQISGSGNGEITTSGVFAIYSDGSESLLFTAGNPPEIITTSDTWTFAGDDKLCLTEDTLFFPGTEMEPVYTGDLDLNRMSSSPDGSHIILWQPGCRTIMVLR